MKESLKSGFSFGTTSGIITTLGLIVGLNAGTHSVPAVIGGITSIAVADGLSESTAMHVSKKSESKRLSYIWESTFATLVAKFIVTMTFVIPVILTDLQTAVKIDIVWGLVLLSTLTYFVSEYKKGERWKDILEHLLIMTFVIIAANYVGVWIHSIFS
jgi:VIT1/CCC1 family predicted Fe2+/Mn2+ transporter